MDRKAAGVADVIADLSVGDEELQQAADRLKKNREKLRTSEEVKQTTEGPKLVHTSKLEKPEPVSTTSDKQKPVTKAKTKTPSQSKQAIPKEWSTPTATLNTRVPPEMDQLLDDLLAKQRRDWKTKGQKGAKPTKQAIIQVALEAYFRNSTRH